MDKFEKEVNARVEFKLKELRDSICNRLKNNRHLSYALILDDKVPEGTRHQHYAEAYNEFLNAFEKEVKMLPPSNNMSDERFVELRNNAVDQIMSLFSVGTPESRRVSTVVRIVEELMAICEV